MRRGAEVNESYWSRVREAAISRRRALAIAGTAGAGAALLAACGGGSAGSGSIASNGPSLVFQPADTSKQAVRGGSMKTYWPADITNYDVHNTQNAGQGIPQLAYS